jgi:hypothetical protein
LEISRPFRGWAAKIDFFRSLLGHYRISSFFPVPCVTLFLLSLTHKQLQVGTAPTSVNPLYSSESSQHISIRNKKKEHQWQNKEQ